MLSLTFDHVMSKCGRVGFFETQSFKLLRLPWKPLVWF